MNTILQRRFITPWLKPDFIFKRTPSGKQQEEYIKIINEFVNGVIDERKRILRADAVADPNKPRSEWVANETSFVKDTFKIDQDVVTDLYKCIRLLCKCNTYR